jgi:hypothetical protein
MVLTGVALACENSSSAGIMAPGQPMKYVEPDSNPARCAIWQCRSLTEQEEADMNNNLGSLYYYYISNYNYDCAQLVLDGLKSLDNKAVYYGEKDRYGTSGVRIMGETDLANNAMYISSLRNLGSMTDVIITVLHEQFHLNDPQLHPWGDSYDPEPPTRAAVDRDCAY